MNKYDFIFAKNRREIIEFHEIESKLCTECTKNYVKELTNA